MKQSTKRILAWIMIVILVLMYVSTLVFALIRAPWAVDAFRVSVVATILLPIMFYLIIFFTRILTPARPGILTIGEPQDAIDRAREAYSGAVSDGDDAAQEAPESAGSEEE